MTLPRNRPLLFDSHAHLVADDQQKYPRKPMKRAADAPARAPGVIGIPGGHHGPNPIHEVPDTSRMLRWMADCNVDGIVAVQKRMIYRYDNSYILDSSDAHPEQMLAVVILDAEDQETPDLVRRYIRDHGLSGLRLFGGRDSNGEMPWLVSRQALKAWEVIDEHGIVMDLEVLAKGGGGPSVPTLVEMAQRFSSTRIVLDHLLEPQVSPDDPELGLDERFLPLADQNNIFLKFTSINLDTYREAGVDPAQVLRRAVDMFGAHKIMWGSDIGTSSGTYREMIDRMLVACAVLSDEEQRAVLHDTGKAVFRRGEVVQAEGSDRSSHPAAPFAVPEPSPGASRRGA